VNYEFPVIKNISEVLPAIKDAPEFVVAERDGYTVINYSVMMSDTFPTINVAGGSAKMRAERSLHNMLRRECRGIIFCSKTGDLLRRPLHKFFNVNEREETQDHVLDLSRPHVILEKLDGSMLVPFMLNDEVRWGTKMGLTDVAAPVEEFVKNNPKYEEFARVCLTQSFITPIFEWCSRKQRIVIDYGSKDHLVLIALRFNDTGEYVKYDKMTFIAKNWNLPVVKAFAPATDMNEFMAYVAGLKDMEGFVIRFDDGHMVKAKCDWYVQIHKAKEAILQDRNIVEMILSNTLDDVKAHLLTEDRVRLEEFEDKVVTRIKYLARELHDNVAHIRARNVDRKNFALNESQNFDSLMKAAIFSLFDGCTIESAQEHITKTVASKLSSNKSYDMIKDVWFKGIKHND
jgi:RNA ligase